MLSADVHTHCTIVIIKFPRLNKSQSAQSAQLLITDDNYRTVQKPFGHRDKQKANLGLWRVLCSPCWTGSARIVGQYYHVV